MRKMEEPLNLFCALSVFSFVPWLKQWPYIWILCKIYLTSLTEAFPSHDPSTVLFGECDSLALYFTSTHSLFYTIMCNHTNMCTHANTHSHTGFSDRVSEWYSWCGWRVERETVAQTWFKVRIMLPYENDLISKSRKTVMDTLKHKWQGTQQLLRSDNNLINTEWYDFGKTWQRGMPHDVSVWLQAPLGACESANHDIDGSKQGLHCRILNTFYCMYDAAQMAVFSQTIWWRKEHLCNRCHGINQE